MTRSTLLSLAAGALLATTASAQFFTPGNLVVLRVGDPAMTLSSNAAAVYLEEWDTNNNTLVQTVAIPSSQTPGMPSFSQRGFSSSEGGLSLTDDGRYLVLAGYDQWIGGPNPRDESALTVPRVIALVDVLTGTIDTSTRLNDAFDSTEVRGAASSNGFDVWASGSSGQGSVRYATLGSSTSTAIIPSSPTNGRWLGTYKGQLYLTSGSTGAMTQGVLEVGTGFPTQPTTANLIMDIRDPVNNPQLQGFPYGFWFADDDTCYIADATFASPNCTGSIIKMTRSGGVWTEAYQIDVNDDCVRGISGIKRADGTVELWYTGEPAGFVTSLYKVVDNGPTSVPTLIATEPGQTDYRGVQVIRSTIQTATGGCGNSTLEATGSGLTGTVMNYEMSGFAGFPLINISTVVAGLPLTCGCTILYDIGFLAGASSVNLPVPSSPSVVGASIFAQGIDLFAPTCSFVGLQLELTDGKEFIIW